MKDYWDYTCETFFDACRSGKLQQVEGMENCQWNMNYQSKHLFTQ